MSLCCCCFPRLFRNIPLTLPSLNCNAAFRNISIHVWKIPRSSLSLDWFEFCKCCSFIGCWQLVFQSKVDRYFLRQNWHTSGTFERGKGDGTGILTSLFMPLDGITIEFCIGSPFQHSIVMIPLFICPEFCQPIEQEFQLLLPDDVFETTLRLFHIIVPRSYATKEKKKRIRQNIHLRCSLGYDICDW